MSVVETVTDEITRLVYDGTGAGAVGGMATKLQAAQKAAAAGVPMVIASGRKAGALGRVLKGEAVGTYFAPKADRLGARKRWIAFAVTPQGRLTVDAGALQALTHHGKSLLPSGVVDVEGDFAIEARNLFNRKYFSYGTVTGPDTFSALPATGLAVYASVGYRLD